MADPRKTNMLSKALVVTCSLAWAGPALAIDPLESAFRSLDAPQRVAIQEELQWMELFTGVSDGRWSQGTARALMRGTEEIKRRSNLAVKPRINTLENTEDYLQELRAGHYRDVFGESHAPSSLTKWNFLDRL